MRWHGRPSATLVPVVALALAACSGQPSPRDEAERLAGDLADGTVDTAALSNGDRAEDALAAVLGNMAALPRAVEVGDIVETGEDRAVGLTWTWDLGEGLDPWVVETTAEMALVDDRWVTQWSPTLVHPAVSETSSLARTSVDPDRGDIVAPDGTALVTERPVFRIGIDKTALTDAPAAAAAAQDLAIRLGFEDPAAFAGRVAAAGPAAFVVAITIRQDEAEQWNADELRGLPGVLVQPAQTPLGPTSTFARPILGSVGEATAEVIEDSGGEILPGQQVGLSGLQRLYDTRLRGVPGVRVVLRTGETREDLHTVPPVDGEDLVVSLDRRLQMIAEDLLADVEPAAAVVAVRPSDGYVLAAASGPGSGGMNTATVGLYPPGSTFKIATALALLRAGRTPDTPVECSPTITVDGRQFTNYPGYPTSSLGAIPLREAIAQSCNTALMAQRDDLTSADVATAAEALGIGATGTWPFPYAAGSVPDESTGTGHAANLIGQGRVVASPLAMAVAAASVARGATVTPVLVPEEEAAADPPRAPLTDEEAAAVRTMMRDVVLSGTSTFLRDVPGEPVHAKSGTAQFGAGEPPETHAWMIAFQGDLAVAVFVEVGGAGTATAGPLLEDFLRNAAG